MRRIKELKNKLLLTVFCIAVLFVFWYFKVPCLYKCFFGIECMGCGMSRAFWSALRLDFTAAFSYHPMFWSVPILYLYFLYDGKLLGKRWVDTTVLVLIAAGFVINWIVKICI